MPSSGSMRAQIGTLIVATSAIQLANGFFGTFLSLRVAFENFSATMAGLVLSSYFAGFTLGALRCGRIIERIGHIRAYAAFAGLVAAATAVMPLLVGPLPWVGLRAIIGFGCAGIFVTTESWLNAKALPSERGRVFSIYMVGTFLALAAGQLLIAVVDVGAAAPFNAIVALFAAALVVVSSARAEPPRVSAAAKLSYGLLVRAAPVAVTGCVLSGLVTGAFYALVPAWMQGEGIERETIALFMLMTVLWRPCVSNTGRPPFRPFRSAHGAGLARSWLCKLCHRLGQATARPAGDHTRRDPARGVHVSTVPCLRHRRARPLAGRSGGGSKRATHPGQRARLGARSADWRHPHGAFRYRWRVLFHGECGTPPGNHCWGRECEVGVATASGHDVRDLGAPGGTART